MQIRALPPALFSLLLAVSGVAAVPHDSRHNYRDTPSPAVDGSASSIDAVRDRSRLPYDISGVVGGYVVTVLIWGILLLTIGRKMRRKALDPPKQLELELQAKPIRPSIKTPGLASPPLSARSATSWLKKFKKNDSGVGSSPQSPVLQSPSSFDQKVIEAQREQAQADMERLYAAVMDHDAKKNFSQISVVESETNGKDRRRPSAISLARSQDECDSAASPVKAIYPPDYKNGPVTAPLPQDRLRDQQPPPSPRSILSKRSQVSTNTTGSKSTRFNLKNLRISGPIQRYPGAASDDEARTPLSPRLYAPGAPPSPPSQKHSPASPYDPDEALDQVQPLPRPAPQRLGSGPISTPGISVTGSTISAQQSLPLRSFAEPLRSPGIQTTVLDRRVDKLALGTPKTGVPFTPYSPYMPFTPITPVTPSHLVSKRDRKVREKIEGRRRAAAKEDLVQSPKEIFGDAY
ncbi:hypothetical protein ACN47E_000823 [Coniothyrium glycines]